MVHKHTRRSSRRNPVTVALTALGVLAAAFGIAAFAGAERHDATYTAGDTVAIGFTWPAANGNWVASDGNGDQAGMWVENCKDAGNTPGAYVRLALDSSCRVHVVVSEGAGHAYAIHQVSGTSVSTTPTTAGTTPTTTATTASTSTTATTTTTVNTGCDFAFAQTTKSVTGPCTVSGDVMVSTATSWTDNDDTTGHGFVIPAGTTVQVNAPWSAYADPRPASEVVKSMVTLGGGCADKAPKDGVLDGCRVATILNLDGTVVATATMSTTGTTASTMPTTTTSAASTSSTTSPTTSTTAATGSTTTVAGTNCQQQVAKGQTVQVKPGCATIGDIAAGSNVHDNDGNTFMVCVNSGSSPVSVTFNFPGEVFNAADAAAVITRETNAGRTSQTDSTPCALAA